MTEFNLSEKIFKNKMIMEGDGYFFLSIEDVKEKVQEAQKRLKESQTRVLISMPINKENCQIEFAQGTIIEMMNEVTDKVFLEEFGDKFVEKSK